MAFWGQRTLTDTERFVETVAPLATDQAIINAVADTVTTALTNNVNLEAEVKGFLPPIAAPLAGPISSAIPTFVKQVTLRILNCPKFEEFRPGVDIKRSSRPGHRRSH